MANTYYSRTYLKVYLSTRIIKIFGVYKNTYTFFFYKLAFFTKSFSER